MNLLDFALRIIYKSLKEKVFVENFTYACLKFHNIINSMPKSPDVVLSMQVGDQFILTRYSSEIDHSRHTIFLVVGLLSQSACWEIKVKATLARLTAWPRSFSL